MWLSDFIDKGVTYEKRPDGTVGSIVSYETSYLLTIGWLIPRRGSVFRTGELLGIFSLVLGIASILGFLSCESKYAPNSCIQLADPNTTYLTLLTLCSFTIAYFANTVLNRYNIVLLSLFQLIGATKEAMFLYTSAITALIKSLPEGIHRKERITKAKASITYLIGLWLFAVKTEISRGRNITAAELFIENQFFTAEQKELLLASLNGGKPSIMHTSMLMAMEFQEAYDNRLIGQDAAKCQANLQLLLTTAKTMRAAAAQITIHTDIQLPFPFIQIITTVCYTFTIQLIIVSASFIAVGTHDSPGYFFIGYLTLVLYSIVLFGLLRLFSLLENPLGSKGADMPADTYYNSLVRQLTSLQQDTFFLIDSMSGISIDRSASKASMSANPIHVRLGSRLSEFRRERIEEG